MLPHVACGGCTPSPRNESADSARIAAGTPSVIATRTGAIALGRMWRQMMRNALAPIDCDHRTHPRSRSDRNSARTTRATPSQPGRPMTTPPASASWLRRRARQKDLTRSPAAPARGDADSRIDQAVGEVGDEVGAQGEQGHDDEVAHHHRVVALPDRLDHELSHAGNGEDRLDDDAAADQAG